MTAGVTDTFGSASHALLCRVVRRTLAVSLAVSILGPLVCLVVYARLDYGRRLADVDSILVDLSRVSEEHALRLFDLNAAIMARALELLGDRTREEIRQREPQIHRRLEAFVNGYPQIASLSVFGAAGDLIASSRYSPPPAVAIADRGDFNVASPWYSHPYISLPLYRRIDGETVLVSSVGRASDGNWSLGIVSVALRRKYLIDFYTRVVGSRPGYTVSLYRREGAAVLASSSPDSRPDGLGHNPDFTQALRENVVYGSFRQEERGPGRNLLVSFRRVGDYPVYVVSSFDLDELRRAWLRGLAVLSFVTLIPGVIVCTWMSILLVRLRANEAQQSGGPAVCDAPRLTEQEGEA